MKHRIGLTLTSLALAVLLLAGSAHAQFTAHIIKVKVPFEFNVGNQAFPAGEYSLVSTAPYLLLLRDSQAHVLATLVTRSVHAPAVPASAKLEFDVEGGYHRLIRVWQENNAIGQELDRPKPATAVAKRRPANAHAAVAVSQP
jgi:hypothetical protein